jgi:hypothetical protein
MLTFLLKFKTYRLRPTYHSVSWFNLRLRPGHIALTEQIFHIGFGEGFYKAGIISN